MKTLLITWLLGVTLVSANNPANLDGGQTSTVKCGLQNPTTRRVRRSVEVAHGELLDKIVGGVNADPGEYPWMVSMGKLSNGTDTDGTTWTLFDNQCGASIITKDWILTAAHCFVNPDDKSWDNTTSEWTMKLGAENSYDDPDLGFDDVVQFNPSKIIIHESYDRYGYAWDIALVKMPSAISGFSTRINTVCLHESGDAKPTNGTNCIVAGWGQTKEGGDRSDKLKEVEVYILNNTYCGSLDPGMMCAGVLAGGKDSCGGDSGGPLFCPVTSGGVTRYYQAGVVSFGAGCARPDSPGVYADIPYFLNWIKQTISAN